MQILGLIGVFLYMGANVAIIAALGAREYGSLRNWWNH